MSGNDFGDLASENVPLAITALIGKSTGKCVRIVTVETVLKCPCAARVRRDRSLELCWIG